VRCNKRLQVVAEVESLGCNGARFVDGNDMALDAVIFATGYRSNVPSWLQVGNSLTKQADGLHKRHGLENKKFICS
jgi:lysine/ornithine N-monooxygenase